MSRSDPNITPIIFLDTNVLIYLSSYLKKAEELSLPPFTQNLMNFEEIQTELKKILPDSIVDYYLNGCKSLSYLQSKAKRLEDGNINVQILTSRLSKVEMYNGALDGKAHILMAQQGIPYIMRQRASNLSDLISMRLQINDIDDVVTKLNSVFTLLFENDNVIIDYVENDHQTDRIASLAEFLSTHFYLDVIDIWIYACALSIQADQIITFDNYFFRVINNVSNTCNGEKWVSLRKEITKYVKQLYGWEKVNYPISSKLPKDVPQNWPLVGEVK
jgi:predicted nucleic acid-binding protein